MSGEFWHEQGCQRGGGLKLASRKGTGRHKLDRGVLALNDVVIANSLPCIRVHGLLREGVHS